MDEMMKKVQEIEDLRIKIKAGGGEKAAQKQRDRGKMTARERIDYLYDPGTFVEFDLFAKHIGKDYGLDGKFVPADGVVTGYGKINGRNTFCYSEDFTVIAGTFGEMHGRKISKTLDLALKMGCPVIGINDSGGARVTEEMGALSEYGQLFFRHSRASGAIPQIALIMGPVAGGQAYSPALMDFIFMVQKTSYMFIAGPPLVKAVVFEDTTEEELGSPEVHCRISGVADLFKQDDKECLDTTKELLSYIPQNCEEEAPFVETDDPVNRIEEDILKIIPTDPNGSYDMHDVIYKIVDDEKIFEIKKEFAPNIICCFGRMNGRTVGIIGSNPAVMAGCLDFKASQKACRFIRFCDCYNIPILNLQDVPAFLIGTKSERDGIIRHGSKMLYAYSEATVPKITLVLRKAYAGGYLAMCSKDLGADFVFELPTAEICLMGPAGAVNILFRKEMKAAKEAGGNPEEVRQKRLKEFYEKYVNPLYSAGLQHVDDIIDPRNIRPAIINALDICQLKHDSLPIKKHGNMPI